MRCDLACALPETLCVGLTACEEINRFYAFGVEP